MANKSGRAKRVFGLLMRNCGQRRTPAKASPRIHTAEVAGSNPASPTLKSGGFQDKRIAIEEAPERIRGLLLQPYCNPLPQRVLKGAGCALLHIREYMGVGIKGYGDSGVPHHLGDDLGVDVLRQQ